MNQNYSIDGNKKRMGSQTPNKLMRKYETEANKMSAQTKAGRHRRRVTSFITGAKSLLDTKSDISEPSEECWYLNMKIKELEGSLKDKETNLGNLNIDYNKLLNYKTQYDKLKSDNRKNRGIIKNLEEKETMLKELQSKHIKLVANFERMRLNHENSNTNLKTLQIKYNTLKASKDTTIMKLERAEIEMKQAEAFAKENFDKNKDLEIIILKYSNKQKQLEAKINKLTAELEGSKKNLYEKQQECKEMDAIIKKMQKDNHNLKQEIKKFINSKGRHSGNKARKKKVTKG